MNFTTWEDWMAYPWSVWNLLDRLDGMVEENKNDASALLMLGQMLTIPEWNLMATRQVPEGVAQDNFFAKNLAIIEKCEEYRKEANKAKLKARED